MMAKITPDMASTTERFDHDVYNNVQMTKERKKAVSKLDNKSTVSTGHQWLLPSSWGLQMRKWSRSIVKVWQSWTMVKELFLYGWICLETANSVCITSHHIRAAWRTKFHRGGFVGNFFRCG